MERISVFRIHLDQPEPIVARLAQSLSPDEQARAARFRFDHLRRRFTVARGALRAILGKALDRVPASLTFTYGEHGKPALTDGLLSFNLSHSEEWGLCAVAQSRSVGVDLEIVQTRDMAALAARFFSPREAELLGTLPPEQRTAAFFRAWSSKEALVKATGQGLTLPTRQVEVTLLPREQPRLLSLSGDEAAAARWRLVTIDAVPGFAGALCAEGHDWTYELLDWQLK